MPRRSRGAITWTIGVLAFLGPVLASVCLAWWESYTTEQTLSFTYAQDALRHLEETASQFQEAEKKVTHADLPPCSPDDLKLLRQLDLGSSYIKEAGRVARDTLLCTSQGATNPIPLGKPDLVTEQGVSEYFKRELPPQLSHPLNIYVSRGFAMIVDPSLAIDVSTEGPDIELAAFVPTEPDHDPIVARGSDFPSIWFEPIPKGTHGAILDHGYLVSSIRSAKWDLCVVAATPQSYINQRIGHFALYLCPIGVLCGVVCALMVNLFSRMRASFPTMLRRAIRDGSFYVVYQPCIDLQTRQIIGAEALVRWRSSYADIRPDYFIPQAEECGLIQLITDQVVSIVTRDLPEFLKLDPQFRLAINMSAKDLSDMRTVDSLDKLLRVSRARPENIEIEATERAFLQGSGTAELLDALRAKGFTIAIDDFGTGYSSLSCLQSLSLDTLKIDKSFVETIGTDGATSQVVPHIIEMAHSLNLEMVAEGVETEPQALYLARYGVRYAQGWLFGKPMDVGQLCQQIRTHSRRRQAALA